MLIDVLDIVSKFQTSLQGKEVDLASVPMVVKTLKNFLIAVHGSRNICLFSLKPNNLERNNCYNSE